ncbi:uncharacterized protein LOC121859840 isoform X2 [Homarus americanus]|uniref:uncharacterized protein LOC121859840 isoform X2 n=1 Tax=Homarus americanus TaxID=6706 RepID=UPI001C496676|nr:uncharacterized protein LOC121859840 isoform X2 [Homarus americanus]
MWGPDSMVAATLVVAALTFQLAECGSGSVERLLWSLQETMQGGPRSSQLSEALKHFKSFSCTARQDGVYPDLASGCSLYYRCLHGAVYSYSCPAGEALDYGSEECRPEGEVTCPPLPPTSQPCHNQTSGYYPDYVQGCRAYYRCINGSVSGRWWCDDGALWDASTGSCGKGPRLVCSPPSCWGLPDGPHPAPATSCTSYFTCSDGVRTDHVCPYNTIFDYSLKRCVASTSSVCYEQVCDGRVNGLHAAPHAPCHSFFRCFNGALVKLEECPRHQVFDGRRCISSSNFSCWGEGRGTCEGRDDGFHVASDSDCRGFFVCRHQQFIRSFICSPGLVFNGRECVDDQNSICTSRPRLPDCTTKIDGYYTLEKTGCKTFFYCRGGSKLSEHTCPGSHVFNGEQCVDPMLYPCPGRAGLQHPRNFTNRVVRSRRTRDADCGSHPNGYYLDVASHCTHFFYCRGGTKELTQSCPSQQKFNGHRCVPEDDYQCPVIPGAPECTLRGDGVYQDVQESCSSYYQCISGVKMRYKCPEGQLHDGQVCRAASQVYCPSSTLCYYRDNGNFVDTDRGCQGHFLCQNETLMWYRMCGLGEVYNGQECVPHFFYTCPSGVDTACVAKADGFYQDLLSGCRQYYRCSDGVQLQKQECPRSMVFNGVACVRHSAYVCPADGAKDCGSNQRGFFQDVQSGCSRYYYCYDGRKFYQKCPDGKVFNGHTCVLSSQYRCPVYPVARGGECSGVDGYYPDLSTGCSSFYYCRSGRRINYTCTEDRVFNGVQCVPKNQFSCPTISSCKNKINGFYQNILSRCRKYFYCYSGFKYEHTCPGNQVHNGRTCVPASTYTCPSVTEDRDCMGKHTGYYPDTASLCQKYYICGDGVKLQTLTCPQNQVFNGHSCVPFYSYSCPYPWKNPQDHQNIINVPSQQLLSSEDEEKGELRSVYDPTLVSSAQVVVSKSEPSVDLQVFHDNSRHDIPDESKDTLLPAEYACLNLPRGSYSSIDAQCQRFLECGERPRWLMCPSPQVFSPVSNACELPSHVTCPTHNPCQDLDDGIYGETESQCRAFYTCRNKHIHLVTSCPEGQAFSQVEGKCQEAGQVVCGGGTFVAAT